MRKVAKLKKNSENKKKEKNRHTKKKIQCSKPKGGESMPVSG